MASGRRAFASSSVKLAAVCMQDAVNGVEMLCMCCYKVFRVLFDG